MTLNGNYDADSQNLNIDGQMPLVTYGENHIENVTLKVFNENNALQYALNAGKVSTDKMELNKVAATGNIANNLITYNISTRDGKDTEQFLIAGNLKRVNNANELSLNPDGLKLNYTNWTVAPDNRLQFGPQGIYAQNFVLSNNGSQISINSEAARRTVR